jgi:UDP-glucose 4-epimerase
VSPVISPRLVRSSTARARSVLERAGDTATAVGRRLRPAPPAPGLRAVRDA